MLWLFCSAWASDGVEILPLEVVVAQSDVIAVATLSDPVWTSQKTEIPLPTQPPRTLDWSEQVVTLTIAEVLKQPASWAPPQGNTLTAIEAGADQHFDRSVAYEVDEIDRGIIHRRYEGALGKTSEIGGTQVLVFLDVTHPTSEKPPAHEAAWTAAYGTHAQVVGMDALSARKRVEGLLKKPR